MILVQFALLTFINIAQDFWDRTVALRTRFRRTAQLKNLKLFIRIWKKFLEKESTLSRMFSGLLIRGYIFQKNDLESFSKKSNILEDRVSAGLKQK